MSTSPARPVHLRPSMVLFVATGGAVGTAAREALAQAIPSVGGLPLGILLINLAGAFVLGVLLRENRLTAQDVGRRRLARLALGTGFCGGFTTYSTLAVGAAALLRDGASGLGIAYAVGTVLLGGLASWAGVLVGSRR